MVYSPDLSYDELLTREDEIKKFVQSVLEEANGEFIHFEAMGDALRFQCVLPEERESVFQTVCDKLAPQVKDGLDARLLLVDKDLGELYFYTIVNGIWQEAVMSLPPAGYLAKTPVVELARFGTDHPKQKKK